MGILAKIVHTYCTSAWSWLVAITSFFLTWLGDSKELLLYIFILTCVDTIFGIIRSHKNGVGIKSSGLRKLISKLLVYFIIIFMTVMLDKSACFDSIIITRCVTAILMGAEVISTLGSMAIIFPQIGALKIVKNMLYSEIADKLHTDKSELEKYMENKND